MGIDRRAWEERQATERKARPAPGIPADRLRQAAVPMERLTGTEHWDTFLRYGEQLQEDARAALAQVTKRLSSTEFLSDISTAALRHQAAMLSAGIVARQELLDLPKSIVAQVKSVVSQ